MIGMIGFPLSDLLSLRQFSELIDLILGGEGRVDRGNFLIRGFAVVDVVIGNDRVGMDLFLKVFLVIKIL